MLRDITIVGNTVINPPGVGISVASVRDVVVEGNTVEINDRELPSEFPAIELFNVSGEVLRDNTVIDPNGKFSDPQVRIGP